MRLPMNPETGSSHKVGGMPDLFSDAVSHHMKPFECNELLREILDQPELVGRLLNMFVGETKKDIENLAAALGLNDATRVAIIAHRIKGSAATIGAEPLRAQAARIEGFGRQGQLQQALDCVPLLRDEFARFCSYVSGHTGSE